MVKVFKNKVVVCVVFDGKVNLIVEDVVVLVKVNIKVKFDEIVEIVMNLGVDLCYVDQMVCGVVILLNGMGKYVCVVVFVCGFKVDEVKVVGVEIVGVEDLLEIIQLGKIEFDCCIVILDMMLLVGCLGKILGLCNLMLNFKVGMVMMDVKLVVEVVKGGEVQFKVEKVGVVYVGVGKVLFDVVKLVENICVFVDVVNCVKFLGVKGIYVKKVLISLIMGLGVLLDVFLVVVQ